jgi:hypothetical protein
MCQQVKNYIVLANCDSGDQQLEGWHNRLQNLSLDTKSFDAIDNVVKALYEEYMYWEKVLVTPHLLEERVKQIEKTEKKRNAKRTTLSDYVKAQSLPSTATTPPLPPSSIVVPPSLQVASTSASQTTSTLVLPTPSSTEPLTNGDSLTPAVASPLPSTDQQSVQHLFPTIDTSLAIQSTAISTEPLPDTVRILKDSSNLF